jgi:hypothetical protein
MMKVSVVLLAAVMLFGVQAAVLADSPDLADANTQMVLAALKSKEWVVYVAPSKVAKGESAAVETDVFTFTDYTLTSKNLSEQGYSSGNINLYLGDGGSATMETMPSNEAGDLAFIRVGLSNGAIGGVISITPADGSAKKVYNFSSAGAPRVTRVTENAKKGK